MLFSRWSWALYISDSIHFSNYPLNRAVNRTRSLDLVPQETLEKNNGCPCFVFFRHEVAWLGAAAWRALDEALAGSVTCAAMESGQPRAPRDTRTRAPEGGRHRACCWRCERPLHALGAAPSSPGCSLPPVGRPSDALDRPPSPCVPSRVDPGPSKATIAGVTDAYVYDDVGHAVRWMPEAVVTPLPSDVLSAAFRCGTPQLVPHPLPLIPLPLSPKTTFDAINSTTPLTTDTTPTLTKNHLRRNQQLPKMWRARSLGPDVSRHGARWQGRALYWR